MLTPTTIQDYSLHLQTPEVKKDNTKLDNIHCYTTFSNFTTDKNVCIQPFQPEKLGLDCFVET